MPPSVFRSERGRVAIQDFARQVFATSPFPIREREVTTSHGRTHLLEAGAPAAPPLLLLHGTATNSASWLGHLPLWSSHFHVLAPDSPGEPGLSEDRRLGLANDDVERWLQSLLEALELTRVHLVGMSLGGFAALRFATRQPHRVAALGVIAPSGLAPQRLDFLFKALPLMLLGDWGLDRVNRMVCGDVELPETMLEFGHLVAKHFRPVGTVPVLDDDELRKLRMPVLYLAGARDALLRTRESAERLARLVPQAEVHVLDDSGHVVLGQERLVLDFLLRNT